MKNKILIICALLLSNLSFSQTKKETEDWIKSFVSTYTNGNINFNNGILTYENPFDPIGFHIKGVVSIKELGGVKVSGGTIGHTGIYLSCYDGKCVNAGLKNRNDLIFENFSNNKLSIQTSSEISYDLQKRIEKAFNHLIKLYGGKGLDNTF